MKSLEKFDNVRRVENQVLNGFYCAEWGETMREKKKNQRIKVRVNRRKE